MPEHALYNEPLRPRFHFTSRYWDDYRLNPGWHEEGWINDVNGLMQLDGEYHLFAQRWWSCWLHAVSTDLVHWQELPPAFGKEDHLGGTQSGGGVVDYANTSGLATGETPVMVAFWSSTDNESQCISYSNDRGRTWTKYAGNPVLSHACRDPQVFWHEPTKQWIMVLYGPEQGKERYYTLFSSPNLLEWEKLHSIPDMHECPDMFELPVDGNESDRKWVVVNGDADYLVGTFDGKTFTPETKKLTGDHAPNYYATMTWGDFPEQPWRRVQIAWMRYFNMDLDMPFSQQLSFPCDLTLRRTDDGIRLCQCPVPEIRELYADQYAYHMESAKGDLAFGSVTDGALDIEASINLERTTCRRFRFAVNGYPLTFQLSDKYVNILGRRIDWKPSGDRLQLRILADTISIEVFIDGGQWASSNIVLPVEAGCPLRLQVDDGALCVESLEVRTLRSMWEGVQLYQKKDGHQPVVMAEV